MNYWANKMMTTLRCSSCHTRFLARRVCVRQRPQVRERSVGRRQQRETDRLRLRSAAEARPAESHLLRQCGLCGARGAAGNPVPRHRLRRLEPRRHTLHHGRCAWSALRMWRSFLHL